MVTPAAVAAGAALAAGGILRAAEQEALLSGPEYIRDAQPEGIGRRLGLGLARAACQSYANNPDRVSGVRAVQFENACRPYLDSLNGGEGPQIELPFRGGQCAAILYDVVVNWTGSTGQPTTVTRQYFGPLRGFYFEPPNQFGNVLFGVRATAADGVSETREPVQAVPQTIDINPSFGSITRADGQPDNCGNPPPETTDPKRPVVPFPFPVPIIIAPEINIDGNVEINPDGTINIDIGTGPITIDPFGGDGDGGGTGGGGPDDSPPSPEPGPELPGGNGGFGGDDPFGPPPVGRRWVGACITITNKPTSQPPIPGSEPEDVYAAVVGNIRLVYQASGTRQTDTPVRIQAKKVCVWEAVRKLNPTGISVDLQPGFGYNYRPYSVPLDA